MSRPNTQYPAAYSNPGVIPDQLPRHPAASSSIPPSSFQQAIAIVTAEANTGAAASNLTSTTSQMPLIYPHSVSATLAPPRTQMKHRHSYPMDARYPPGSSVHSVRVGGAGTSAPRPSALAGTNTPPHKNPIPPTATQSVPIPAHPDTNRLATAPIPAPPPEIAPLLHPAIDLPALQQKLEGSLSQVGVSLGAIWRHTVETTTLEVAKHRSDTLRWKERCLQFEEMYKNCKQKLDNMNHDNIMLQTQISRLQAELNHVRGQGRPVGPSLQMIRHQGAFPSQGQDHVAHERARTVSSLHPTPASAVEELPPSSSHTKEISATPFREKSVIGLSGDREDAEIAPFQSEKIGQNEPPSARCTTEKLLPTILPPTAIRVPTPPEQRTTPSVITPQRSSPEVPTCVTTSPKSSRSTPPLHTHGISGLLSLKPTSTIQTVTPVKPRNNVNNSTLITTPMLGTFPTALIPPAQTTGPAASSSVDEPEEELEEGEVKCDTPMVPPMNEKVVQNRRLPVPPHAVARAGPAKRAPSHSESVPPLSLYFKPSQPTPQVPKEIPKKRPFESGEEGPIKKARPGFCPSPLAGARPRKQTGIGSRSIATGPSRPGTVERSSTQGSVGVPKSEPKSSVLPPNTPASSRSNPAENMVKPPYEGTAVTAPDPPPGYVSSQKEGLDSLITRELRRQDEVIYCHPCICEYERDSSKPVTRFIGQPSIAQHVLYHFESQHTEWWEKVQSDASN